jgi:hypothetical protein
MIKSYMKFHIKIHHCPGTMEFHKPPPNFVKPPRRNNALETTCFKYSHRGALNITLLYDEKHWEYAQVPPLSPSLMGLIWNSINAERQSALKS